jgi:hypothetical protein
MIGMLLHGIKDKTAVENRFGIWNVWSLNKLLKTT